MSSQPNVFAHTKDGEFVTSTPPTPTSASPLSAPTQSLARPVKRQASMRTRKFAALFGLGADARAAREEHALQACRLLGVDIVNG
jgi:hypothetical protein